jgi:hypothetical protein
MDLFGSSLVPYNILLLTGHSISNFQIHTHSHFFILHHLLLMENKGRWHNVLAKQLHVSVWLDR